MKMSNRKTYMSILVVLSHALLAIGLLVGNVSAQQPNASLRVTILVYSGRPDPTYVLGTANDLNGIRTRMQNLKEIHLEQKTIIPSVLGYRGMILETIGQVEGLPQRFAVSSGKIEVMGTERHVYVDQNHELEKLLLRQAVANKAINQQLATKLIAGTVESPKRP